MRKGSSLCKMLWYFGYLFPSSTIHSYQVTPLDGWYLLDREQIMSSSTYVTTNHPGYHLFAHHGLVQPLTSVESRGSCGR